MTETPKPTGSCFCGCGATVGYGRYFAQGHDKMAEAALIALHYGGSVAQLLQEHKHGPERSRSVTKAAVDAGIWQECPKGCGYVGAPESIRNHLKKHEK